MRKKKYLCGRAVAAQTYHHENHEAKQRASDNGAHYGADNGARGDTRGRMRASAACCCEKKEKEIGHKSRHRQRKKPVGVGVGDSGAGTRVQFAACAGGLCCWNRNCCEAPPFAGRTCATPLLTSNAPDGEETETME